MEILFSTDLLNVFPRYVFMNDEKYENYLGTIQYLKVLPSYVPLTNASFAGSNNAHLKLLIGSIDWLILHNPGHNSPSMNFLRNDKIIYILYTLTNFHTPYSLICICHSYRMCGFYNHFGLRC